ncbi:hypothetical protein [Nocardia asiatica]
MTEVEDVASEEIVDLDELDDLDAPNAWESLPVRRRRRHRVTVLLDAADEANVVAALLDAHNPSGPVVTVHPTPGMHSSSALALDILAALGRPVRHLGAEKSAASAQLWHMVRAWVAAEDIERLVVLRAQRLYKDCCNALVELWRETGVGVVLVCHATSRTAALAMLPAGINPRVVASVATLVRHFPAPLAPDVDDPVEELADVPDIDVVAFRAEAYRRLSRTEFTRVDEVYRRGMAAACRWLHGHPGPVKPVSSVEKALRRMGPTGVRSLELRRGAEAMAARYSESELRDIAAGLLCLNGPRTSEMHKLPYRFDDDDGLDRFLTGLVADCPTRNHTITLLRGAQAGALLHGLLIQLPGNLRRAAGPGMTGRPITAELAARIRAGTVSPVHAAALACAVFTGFDRHELARIPISGLSMEAGWLRWNNAERYLADRSPHWVVISVPHRARPMLAAARTFLSLRGLEPHKSLFSGAISSAGQILPTTATRARIALPPTISTTGSWTGTASAWWVGAPLHTEMDYSR